MRLIQMTAVLLAAASLYGPAADTAKADKLEIATQDDAVLFYQRYGNPNQAYDYMNALQVDYLRVNVNWVYALHPSHWRRRSVPRRPRWDFNYTDRIVSQARARGIRLQFTMTGPAPAWATANKRVGAYRPSPRLFGRFVSAFARRYRGQVRRWAIWNEPNQPGWLRPQARCRGRGSRQRCTPVAPLMYRRLYQEGYRAARSADRRNRIWIGELAPTGRRFRTDVALAPRPFMRGVLCLNRSYKRRRGCAALRAHGFAHHPYPLSARRQQSPRWRGNSVNDITIASYSRLRLDLRRFHRSGALRTPGGRMPPVYYTEMGFQTGGPRAISERRQASYYRTSLAMARRQPGVKQYLVYTLYDEPPGRKWIAGLIRYDGTPKLSYHIMVDGIRNGLAG